MKGHPEPLYLVKAKRGLRERYFLVLDGSLKNLKVSTKSLIPLGPWFVVLPITDRPMHDVGPSD